MALMTNNRSDLMTYRKIFPALSGLLAVAPLSALSMFPGEDGGNVDAGPSDSTSGTVGTGNEDRLAMFDRIADQLDVGRADELADVNEDGSTAPFTPPVAEGEDPDPELQLQEEATRAEAERIAADQTPEEVPVAKLTKIKVNGEEVELTPELIAKAMKVASADKYLEEAAATKRAAAPESKIPEGPSAEDVRREAVERDRALVRAIQVGTEDEALAALQSLRQSTPTTPKVDVDRMVDARLEFKTALSKFNDEFKDLVSDPQLHSIVLNRDAQLVEAGDDRTYSERFEAVGKEVRAWRDSMVAKFAPVSDAPKPPVASMTSKEKAKASAPSAPPVASATAKQAPAEDDGDEDSSSVIAKMAKSRGGPQWAQPRS